MKAVIPKKLSPVPFVPPGPKAEWTKEPPAVEGWFWIKFRSTRKGMIKRPALILQLQPGVITVRADVDFWVVGGKDHGPRDKTLRFGPPIPEPAG